MEPTLLSGWESFYVIVGSGAAGLTGLQFVVMTLINERQAGSGRVLAAFATPTVVHFGAVVLIASVLSAPWHGLLGPSLLVGGCGIAGVGYGLLTISRMRSQRRYAPVLEDWIFHAVLPLLAYAAVTVAASALGRAPERALFWVAAAALLLLFVGIHNAWDTVTYIATELPTGTQSAPSADAAATREG